MYQSYYNLSGKPFRLSPDPGFFFPSRGHKRALAYLRYGLSQNEGFVVITGAPGTGKTTLAQILLEELGDKSVVVAHLTTTQLDADDMLRMVAASFGLRYEGLDKAGLLKTIESFLLARSRERKRALLVIDEAQNLPARSLEELRMLSNLQVGDKALLQTFLLGQNQFRQMLDHPDLEQLRQRVIANFHLGPLAADESQRYIESRLKQVSWNGDPRFAEVAFEKIHGYTEGIPRRINMLCDRIMLFGCMEEKHEMTGEVVDLVIEELEQEISGGSRTPKAQLQTGAQNQTQQPVSPAVRKTDVENAEFDNEDSAELDIDMFEGSVNSLVDSDDVVTAATNEPEADEFEPDIFSSEADDADIPQLTYSEFSSADNFKSPNNNSENTNKDSNKDTNKDTNKDSIKERPEQKKADSKIENNSGNSRDDAVIPVASPDEVDFIEITEDFLDEFDRQFTDEDIKRREPVFREPAKNQKAAKESRPKEDTSAKSVQEKSSSNKPPQNKVTSTVTNNNKAVAGGNGKKPASSSTGQPDMQTRNKHEKVAVPDAKNDKDIHDQDVFGNTVKHKNVSEVDGNSKAASKNVDSGPEHVTPQISERELFRVIPGGKTSMPLQVVESETYAPAARHVPTSEDVVLRRILRLVLAFHRSPSSFPGLDDPSQPLPEGVSELLELAVADDQILTKVSPASVMGISPVMLRAAVRFFVRRTLFAGKGDHYRVLGLTPLASQIDIEKHYDLLMRLLRQDKQAGVNECVAMVGQAYEALSSQQDHEDRKKEIKVENESDQKAAAVLQALENPELTIDFNEEIKPVPRPTPVSAIMNLPNEPNRPDPRVTRRRIHILGQAAIVGIGGLVFVLGILITQLEPGENESNKTNKPSASTTINESNPELVASSQGQEESVKDVESSQDSRLNLSFNDGRADTASKSASDESTSSGSAVSVGSSAEKPESTTDTPVNLVSSKSEATNKPVNTETRRPVEKSFVAPQPRKQPRKQPEEESVIAKAETVPVLPTDSAPKKSTENSQASFKPVPVNEKPGATRTEPVEVKAASVSSAATTSVTVTPVPVKQKSGPATTPSNQFQGKDIPIAPIPEEVTDPDSATEVASMSSQPVKQQLAITEDKLEQLLSNYTNAFAQGDAPRIMSLFSDTARTNERTSKSGIETEYKQLFAATSLRDISLNSLFWENEGDFARGVGQFRANIEDRNGGNNNIKGKFTMQVQVENGQVKISRFYLSEKLALAPSSAAGPSNADLKQLLTEFTRYYENGDINKLMTLFADTAKTNDQNTLAGIRKDHLDLFNATQVRQMFLKNINWNVSGNSAKGNGDFEVMIQSKGSDKFSSVAGTVNLEVSKTKNGRVQFTEFFHKTK